MKKQIDLSFVDATSSAWFSSRSTVKSPSLQLSDGFSLHCTTAQQPKRPEVLRELFEPLQPTTTPTPNSMIGWFGGTKAYWCKPVEPVKASGIRVSLSVTVVRDHPTFL
jgi:hypothetical protein